MAPVDDNLLKRLLATFRVEAREHIDAVAAGLIELERADSSAARVILDSTFRAAHSLKGAARAVNVRDVELLCQSLESVFGAARRKEAAFSTELFDLLHRAVAMLRTLLQLGDGDTTAQRPAIADLLSALRSATSAYQSTAPSPHSEPAPVVQPEPIAETTTGAAAETRVAMTAAGRATFAQTIRVDTRRLDAVLLQSEELLSAKQASTQQARRLRQFRQQPAQWKKRWMKLRPDVRHIRRTLEAGTERNPQWSRVCEFLDWSRDCIEALESGLVEAAKVADHDQRVLGTMIDNLLDEMKKVVVQPFSTLLDVLPSAVRELSRDQGKLVELSVKGAGIEIDRRILEEMKDPLLHLVRNCIDHGIEKPDVRAGAGKPPHGTLTVTISAQDGNHVELLIGDDGRGIDAAEVRASLVRQGLLPAQEAGALNDADALAMVFQSGVSTSAIITDISGRGLGLAIVKEKVEKLTGSMTVDTRVGQGTAFRIVLPLTLARFRGVLIRAQRDFFVLPTMSVERVTRVAAAEIVTVENRETIVVQGQVIALARLARVLELPAVAQDEERTAHYPVVVLANGNQRIAFLVDEVINEQEVLVKPLGKQLVRVRNVAGATVLGNGRVVPLLNVPDLLDTAVRTSASAAPAVMAAASSAEKQSVLVAEDSITSRILLKNILESAGYRVETAVDGMDALTILRSGQFDLVVSDVEMPRMDGIGLTTQLRADHKLSQIPVILVTALNSREDRERGVDAGANAYIVKSSFDQSSLLEVVRRLI